MRGASPLQPSASRLASDLVNIRAITNHFNPKINKLAAANPAQALTREQVLDIVTAGYDQLVLKMCDGLDTYEKFSENPSEIPSLTSLVRLVIRKNANVDMSIRPLFQARPDLPPSP